MAVYEIKYWNGGISPFTDRGIEGSFKFAKNIDIRKTVDSLSCGQSLEDEGLFGESHSQSPSLSPSASYSPSGSASASVSPSATASASNSPSMSSSPSKSLSPSASASPSGSTSASPSMSEETFNIFEDLIRFFVKCSDGNTYGFGNTGFVYRRFPDGYWRNVYRDPHGAIKGAEEKPSSDGKTYLQWATDTKVKRKEIPGNSGWTDVEIVAENLTGADWHTMKQVGGANIIANGSRLAMVGYDDSYTNEALIFPGDIAKSLLERNGRAIIGSHKAGYPNKGINAMIDVEVPLSQLGEDGEIIFADMASTLPTRRFPGGGRVNPGGVASEVEQVNFYEWDQDALSWIDKQTVNYMSLWGVYDATSGYNGIYTYGRRNKEQPFSMNLEYELDVDEIGAVTNVDGVTLASYRDGTVFGVKAVSQTVKADGVYESLEFRAPIKKDSNVTVWDRTELFFDPLPSGASIEFYYKLNKSDSWTQAYTINGASSYSTSGGKKAVFRLGEEGEIFEEQIKIYPSGNNSPEILRSRTYFH